MMNSAKEIFTIINVFFEGCNGFTVKSIND